MERKQKKSFLSLLFVIALDNFGFALVFIMFAPIVHSPHFNFLAADTPFSMRNLYLGFLFAAYPLSQLFGAPILGDYADRAGRKKALVISIVGIIIGFAFSAISCSLNNIYLLIGSRLFTGFFAGNLSICMSAIADISPNEKLRSHNFSLMMVVWGVSWNLAMLAGGYLSNPSRSELLNPSLPFWLTGALTLLSLIAIRKYYIELHPPKEKVPLNLTKGLQNIRHAFKLKQVRPYFLIILVWTIGWGLSVEWFGTFSMLEYQTNQEAISWGLLIQGVFWMLGGLLINPPLLKKFSSLSIALIGNAFCTLFLFLTVIPNQFLFFAMIYWASTAFGSCAFSNNVNLASIRAPEGSQGKIMGLTQSMMSLGWVIVPAIGAFIGTQNPKFFYPVSATFVLLAFLLLFAERRKEKAGNNHSS